MFRSCALMAGVVAVVAVVASLGAARVSAQTAAPQSTQRLSGAVRAAGTGAPLPGAVVTVIDSAGAQRARTIADAQGRFTLAVPAHAARVRVVRIGFRPNDVPLPARLDTPLELVMEHIPPLLEAVKVSDKELCPDSPQLGPAFALWEQARAGLLAAIVAREQEPAKALTLVYERRLSPNDELVREQHVRTQFGSATRPFLAAAGASYFAKVGYMSEGADGRLFSAPDADVLLDPSFAATHCFRIQRADRDHPAQVGLAFVPAPGRDSLVDVSGVIWLDEATPQLRTFDFQYTSLEPAAMQAKAGGHLAFRSMANGVSFIERWSLRLPVLTPIDRPRAYRPARSGVMRRQDRDDLMVSAISEAGGAVLDAVWPDGETWHSPRALIDGQVVRRSSGLAVPNAVVTLSGTNDSVTTDSTGRFRLDVVPGRYLLVAADTLLREFVAERADKREVAAALDRSTAVRIEVDQVASAVADLCRGQEMRDNTSIVVGHAVLSSGDVRRDARVVADWQADYTFGLSGVQISAKRQEAPLDDKGRFIVCGAARERPIHLRLFLSGNDILADTTFKILKDRLTYALTWPVTAPVVADGATLVGMVVAADQHPVAGADVLLPEAQRMATTDERGRFQISGAKPGRYLVRLRRVGYAQVVDSLTLPPRARVTRTFVLTQVATLDTVRSVAQTMHYISPALRDFEERSRSGTGGSFVVDSTLRARENQKLSDVLRALVPGLQLEGSQSTVHVLSARDQRAGRHALDVGTRNGCYSTIYVNGVLVFELPDAGPRPPLVNINDYTVSDLTGIEFYPGPASVPARFRGSECGTLLLWTREK